MAKLRRHFQSKYFPWVFVVILTLAVFGAVQLVRAATGGISGSPGTKYDAVQATDSVSTDSESYALMPNMTVGFATSSQAPAVVIISSSPRGVRNLNCGYIMRLKVDGVIESAEIPVLLAEVDSRSFTFVTGSLSPGSHTANIEWRVAAGFTSLGCADVRSMVVMHQ